MSRLTRKSVLAGSIKPGEPITAQNLNAIADQVNLSQGGAQRPTQAKEGVLSGVTKVYGELSRTSITHTLTDSNSDTVDVEVITSITFQGSEGERLVFYFNNPSPP